MSLWRQGAFYFQRTERWGTICRLPPEPLAYQNTPPGGEIPPVSTLAVEVVTDGVVDPWDEVIDLIHSDDSTENGDHFMVETDELGRSLLRFGNGINGRQLPVNAQVRCRYQVGLGLAGNIGFDQLRQCRCRRLSRDCRLLEPLRCGGWTGPGTCPEVIRRAPEA
ncbi:hypothetical protein [Halomicronema hongdechloris]|uniref:hypothetical protein n=1 Tax=Halomicronema hongdechloris TaxID=1209493 RepID=UPI000B4DADF7|nr:hypothetical protein [Halomicronema hongdechloris]